MTKQGRSTGEMLRTMGYASLMPNNWFDYKDHDPKDDPLERLERFNEFAMALSLSYDLKVKGHTVKVRFTLEKR